MGAGGQAGAGGSGSNATINGSSSSSGGGGSGHLPMRVGGGSYSPPPGPKTTGRISPPRSPSSLIERLRQLRAKLLPTHHHYEPQQLQQPQRPSVRAQMLALGSGLALVLALYHAVLRHWARPTLIYAAPGRAGAALAASHGAKAASLLLGAHDCVPADVLLGGRLGPSGDGREQAAAAATRSGGGDSSSSSSGARPIPMVATNLDFDTEKYLTRFVGGLDFPIERTLVAWGGCDPLVAEQVDWLLGAHPDVRVFHARRPLGCAGGWNAALAHMAAHDDVPWALIFNSDMLTPPGSLETFAAEIWGAMDADPRLCVGHFNTRGAGQAGRYTSFLYTRHALNALGTIDANIYPAYYEDVELDIRLRKAVAAGVCSPIRVFNGSEFVHGREGATKYLSGSKVMQQRMASQGDAAAKATATAWAARIKRGKLSSPLYLQQKWGCRPDKDIDLDTCVFERPFDNPERPLSFWELDAARRRCIDEGEEVAACRYALGK